MTLVLRRKPRQEEHAIQCAFIAWIDRVGIIQWPELVFGYAIPNVRSGKMDAILRWKEGARSGPADWCLPLPHGAYCGFAMEFKRPKGRTQATQRAWLSGVSEAGWWLPHEPVDSVERAIEHVTDHLAMHPRYDVAEVRRIAQELLDARLALRAQRVKQRTRRRA